MKIVLALGGNALQSDPKNSSADSQIETCRKTAKSIVDLIEMGHRIVIVHGNGPQVGQIISSVGSEKSSEIFPFDACSAFSQGYIGYHLQATLEAELKKRNIEIPVGTVITQTLVDKNDAAMKNPTKPIGSFYTIEEAKELQKEKGYIMKEDAGRGYRRVVPSPKPIDILEKDIIKKLFNSGSIVICCGGGGIPVVMENGNIKGIPAVIDKDLAAEKLAEIVDADALLILTSVDKVYINYNKPDQRSIDCASLSDIKKYMKDGQFAEGSMLPKIKACKSFIENNKNKIAIIASLDKAQEALEGKSGTRIVYRERVGVKND